MVVICLGLSSGGVRLHEATVSWVGCAGSIKKCYNQSTEPTSMHTVVACRWEELHLRGCAWMASSALRGGETCIHSGAFCHPIKHTALARGLQLNKLNIHLKYTAWPEGTTEECKLQIQICSHKCECVYVLGLERLKFGARERWEYAYSCLVICCPFGMLLIKFQLSVNTHLHDKIVPAITTENQSQNHNSWVYTVGPDCGVLGDDHPPPDVSY